MRVLADASLPNTDKHFGKPFAVTLFANFTDLLKKIQHADILVCRSTLQVDQKLLQNTNLKCVATATSGTDHVDKKLLLAKNIDLFDAKGANASAVCDYVLSVLALTIKNNQSVISSVGIVGCGEIGSLIAVSLKNLGVTVKCFDPLKAIIDKNFVTCNLKELYTVDAICIHANLHTDAPYPSYNLFNKNIFTQLKPGVILINAARGGIVNEKDLLANRKKLIYCTDVFANEPNINPKIIEYAQISTPHIAGHSVEAKNLAVAVIANKVRQKYLLDFQAEEKHKIADANWDSLNLNLNTTRFVDFVLNKYNPGAETLALKTAKNKTTEFLTLRKKHKFRHSFLPETGLPCSG